ncbi:ATP-binding protein [Kibdelosporangium phytohabitans]|nr:LuxR C-terminal-related transcriptional regulator [Kibdelosporangium phytohabitans]MBE1467527.1 non-specific serine/threonine protein kinase [Kibdelosporangium phytohabitans]
MNSFIGRSRLIHTAKELLGKEEVRIVTLVGIGGVGKTRAMQQLVDQVRTDYPDGVAVIYLADVTSRDEQLAAAISEGTGLLDNSPEPGVDRLVTHLRDRHMLLVLDNCEHLPHLRHLVRRLLEAAPGLTVLATSRGPLGVRGEHHVRVPPLSVGGEGGTQANVNHKPEALRLLVDRARPYGVAIGEHDYPKALRVCRKLDGIPLAIELAAGQLGPMTLSELLDILENDLLGVLVDGDSEQDHQRTLRKTMDWSWRLLTPSEQTTWSSAAVFEGGFDLDAARQVCVLEGVDHRAVPALITSLVRKSILTANQQDGSTRYRMPETIRAYGLEKLDGDRVAALRHAHATYYRERIAHVAANWLQRDEVPMLRGLRCDLPNLRTAEGYFLTAGESAIALDLVIDAVRTRFLIFAGLINGMVRMLDLAVDAYAGVKHPRLIVGLALAAWIATITGDQERARPLLERAEELAQQSGQSASLHPLLTARGTWAWLAESDPSKARDSVRILRLALRLAQSGGAAPGDIHMIRLLLAISAGFLGEETEARMLASQLLTEARGAGAQWAISWALWTRALVELRFGTPARAMKLVQEALAIQRSIGDTWGLAWSVWLIALIAARLGDYELTGHLLGFANAMQKLTHASVLGLFPFLRLQQQIVAGVRTAIGDEALSVFVARGEKLFVQPRDREILLDRALRAGNDGEAGDERSQKAPGIRPHARPGGLSNREWEVASLIADGLSNREIGERLSIVERTAEVHVGNVLRKLGLHNRVGVANWYQGQRPLGAG